MIVKGGGTLYLFDFDGTLFGNDAYKGYFKQLKETFTLGPYINPEDFDIRWSVLTGRPLIDKPILITRCWAEGLYPERVITTPTFRWRFKSDEDQWEWKATVIKRILLGEDERFHGIRPMMIDKIVYVDNDVPTITYINQAKLDANLNFLAITVQEFVDGKFDVLI